MLRFPQVFIATTLVLIGAVDSVFGQAVDPKDFPVQIDKINFLRGIGDSTLVEVEMKVEKAPPGLQMRNPEFIDDVDVRFTIAFEDTNPESEDERFRYFQSEVKIVTMEQRKRYVVYFFLPTEIRDRDDLPRDPFAGLVEISIGGRAIPILKDNVVGAINAKNIESFLSAANRNASSTEGQMLSIAEFPSWIVVSSRLNVERIPPLYPPNR